MFINQSYEKECEEHIEEEGCAGLIATGSVVKDNRSILWKNRHASSSQENKVWYTEGTNYSFIRITDEIAAWMGTNEEGLSIANFRIDNDVGDLDNGQSAPGPNNVASDDVMMHVLGNYSTIAEAIEYIKTYASGDSEGTQFILTSSEPNTGAIIAMDPQTPNNQYNISWINNTWAAVDNGFWCDEDSDPDNNSDRIRIIINDIVNNSTSSEGDNLINWKDVIQRCAKDVSDKEEGTGSFSYVDEISKESAVSAMCTIAGKEDAANASHVTWLALGRQPIINVFVPIAVATLDEQSDIPYKLWTADGFEKFVNIKKEYCDAGTDQFNCSRVREVLQYANNNENQSFSDFDTLNLSGTESEVKATLDSFDNMTNRMLWNYEQNRTYSTIHESINAFEYVKQINIQANKVQSDLYDFPMLIKHTTNDLVNHAQSDADDIAFFDNKKEPATRLPHEIESYNSSSGEVWAWVKVPHISSSTNTKIYIAYGNSTCGPQENVPAVWDDEYVLVHHYSDNILHDSSQYGHIGNDSEGAAAKKQNGIINSCIGVDESDDTTVNIYDWDDPVDFSSAMTAEMWVYIDPSTTETSGRLMTNGPGYSTSDWCWYMRPGNNNAEFDVHLNGGLELREGNLPGNDGESFWWYTAMRWDDASNDLRVYQNYTEEGAESTTTTIANSYNTLTIGNDGGGGNTWDGYIDEVRISKIQRSVDWIDSCFRNQADPTTFATVDGEEPVQKAPTNNNPYPADGETNQSYPFKLQITVNDQNQDIMNLTFMTNATGQWLPVSEDNTSHLNITSGTRVQSAFEFIEYNTKYWWSTNTTDGIFWTNDTYSFTTGDEPNNLPCIEYTCPVNWSIGNNIAGTLEINIWDAEGNEMSIYWKTWNETTSTWNSIGTNLSVSNGTYQQDYSFDDYGEYVQWGVDISNGDHWKNETYVFKIESSEELGWWNTDWSHRKEIHINHEYVEEDMSLFPVLMQQTDSNFTTIAQEDGDDFVFIAADNETILPHEIETYDNQTGQLIAWVRSNMLSSTENTTIYLYYGNDYPCCENQENVTAVWDSGYVLIQHYADESLKDSSSCNHTSTNYNTSLNEAGRIGNSRWNHEYLGDNGSGIKVNNFISLNESLTAEIWIYINITNTEDFPRLWMEGENYNDCDWGSYLRLADPTHSFIIKIDGATVVRDGSTPGNNGEGYWWYVACRIDADDTNPKGNFVDVLANKTVVAEKKFLQELEDVKNYLWLGNDGSGFQSWNGTFDEVRISNKIRSRAWLNLSYDMVNEYTSIVSFEPAEESPTNPIAVATVYPTNNMTNVSFPFDLSAMIAHASGQTMNISFWTNASGGWLEIGNYTNVTNSTQTIQCNDFIAYATTYWWSVNISDGQGNWLNESYSFTGEEAPNRVPWQKVIAPQPGQVSISVPTEIIVEIYDEEGNTMDIYFRTNASGTWETIGTNLSATNGTYQQTLDVSGEGTTYWWSVNISNHGHWSNETQSFISGYSPNVQWYDSSWSYAKEIRINHTYFDENVTNFPYLIKLTDTNFTTLAQEDGDDFLFVAGDNATILPHEFEYYNSTTGELLVWVNVNFINAYEDTIIWLYYGNDDCPSQENVQGTWNEKYIMVHHYKDNSLFDSTQYAHHGTNKNTTYSEGMAPIYGCRKTEETIGGEGTGIYVENFDPITTKYLVEMWIYINSTASNDLIRILQEGPKWNDNDWGYSIDLGKQNNQFQLRVDGSRAARGGLFPDPEKGFWIYLTSQIDTSDQGDFINLYHNDTEAVSTAFLQGIPDSYSTLYIGIDPNDASASWEGYIDEVRISNATTRSWGWTNATFRNIKNPEDAISAQTDQNPMENSMGLTCNRSFWNISGSSGTSKQTILTWGNITNTEYLEIDVEISASNASLWHVAASPGNNQFNLSFNTGGGWAPFTYEKKPFILNLASGRTIAFGLQVYLPTSASSAINQSTIITYTITPAGSAGDCTEAQSELHTANTANTAYYVDYAEFAPTLSALSDYGYTPSELSTGYLQYNRSANGQEAGYWEATKRLVPCSTDEDAGRWTQTASTGQKVWRNNTELQSWKNSLGI